MPQYFPDYEQQTKRKSGIQQRQVPKWKDNKRVNITLPDFVDPKNVQRWKDGKIVGTYADIFKGDAQKGFYNSLGEGWFSNRTAIGDQHKRSGRPKIAAQFYGLTLEQYADFFTSDFTRVCKTVHAPILVWLSNSRCSTITRTS